MKDIERMAELIRQHEKIMDNCFGNIFVTDQKGNIIYVNQHAVDSFLCSREEFLSMTVYEMVDRKIASDSAAIYSLENQKGISMRITTNKGVDIIVTSRPIFEEHGKLEMVVVYSQNENSIKSLMSSLEQEKQALQQAYDFVTRNNFLDSQIIFSSPLIKSIIESARNVAPSESTVMLYGESGTGKEVLANFIHENSKRTKHVFLPVNCAAIPQELIESEFFGYEGGAFTGSNRDGKEGLFEVTNHGTLFLDEIGELPISMQSKLLRVLDSGEILRLGGTKVKKVDVRILAATNRDLRKMVKEGTFREDLYYRLNVIPIEIPPLRNRIKDIYPLAKLFLAQLNQKYRTNKQLTPSALQELCHYRWPGNIRELKNVIERVYIITNHDQLDDIDISCGLGLNVGMLISKDMEKTTHKLLIASHGGTLLQVTDDFQRQYISEIIESCNSSVKEAAKKLGMHKSGLYKKLKKLQLNELCDS